MPEEKTQVTCTRCGLPATEKRPMSQYRATHRGLAECFAATREHAIKTLDAKQAEAEKALLALRDWSKGVRAKFKLPSDPTARVRDDRYWDGYQSALLDADRALNAARTDATACERSSPIASGDTQGE
jgi:hypothetical protein